VLVHEGASEAEVSCLTTVTCGPVKDSVEKGFEMTGVEARNIGRLSMLEGRTPFASSLQAVIERYRFADSRKMRPSSMLMHPRTKRKKAETRVKSSTWRDKIWVEMRP
jgi:hypothetical protein